MKVSDDSSASSGGEIKGISPFEFSMLYCRTICYDFTVNSIDRV